MISVIPSRGATSGELIERGLATADSLHNAGRTDSALVVGEKTLELAEQSGNPVYQVSAHSAQGVFLRSSGRIHEALKEYNHALEIATSDAFRRNPSQDAIEEISTLYINFGVLNLDMQHKEEAVKNCSTAAEWIEKSEDPAFRAMAYGAAGGVMMSAGEFEKAAAMHNSAYADALKSGDQDGEFRAAAYSMLLAFKSGDNPGVGKWRGICTGLLPDTQATMSRLLYYQAECSIALNSHDPRKALLWFRRILELDGIDGMPFVKFDCYNNMHEAYAEISDYEDAYKTLLVGNRLRDSIWEAQKAESLRDLTVKYETKETELALAQSESRRSQTLMWLFIAIAVLATGAGSFIYYSSLQKRRRLRKEKEFAELRAETERRLTEEYIEGLESERTRMARELHDGICNDLMAVGMMMEKEGSPAEARHMLELCREDIRRVSHELMPPEFAYAGLDEVLRYFIGKRAKAVEGKMTLTYASDIHDGGRDIPDDVALELYRIVQEAVGNAVKYSGGTRVDVTLRTDEGRIELEVNDDGRFRNTDRKGIGLASIKKRAASIKGNVEVIIGEASQEGGGTTVRLTVGAGRSGGS